MCGKKGVCFIQDIYGMSCIKKSNSLTMEEIHKKYFDTMRLTHNDVKFDVTYDDQKPLKIFAKSIFDQF